MTTTTGSSQLRVERWARGGPGIGVEPDATRQGASPRELPAYGQDATALLKRIGVELGTEEDLGPPRHAPSSRHRLLVVM